VGRPATYEIRVEGTLDPEWAGWLGDFAIRHENEEMAVAVLSGTAVDQAALHGILNRIRDLNLVLISVTRLNDPNNA
jgi:hypothetical protein